MAWHTGVWLGRIRALGKLATNARRGQICCGKSLRQSDDSNWYGVHVPHNVSGAYTPVLTVVQYGGRNNGERWCAS